MCNEKDEGVGRDSLSCCVAPLEPSLLTSFSSILTQVTSKFSMYSSDSPTWLCISITRVFKNKFLIKIFYQL